MSNLRSTFKLHKHTQSTVFSFFFFINNSFYLMKWLQIKSRECFRSYWKAWESFLGRLFMLLNDFKTDVLWYQFQEVMVRGTLGLRSACAI